MKYEVTSMNTKKMLADSLKKFMEEKPLSKITVSDIVRDCGVNRKTFYYHFEDINHLFKWIVEREAVEVIKASDILSDFEANITFVIDYVDKNKHMLNCAYDSLGREGMKLFLFSDFIVICRRLIDELEAAGGFAAAEDYKVFLSEFYAEAIAGTLINFLCDREKRSLQQVSAYLSLTIKESIYHALKASAESK
ncbi:MAG: TetR/AcrR family transcriptional regulator C-terminal domain-containing protein [Anaerovoracaceae bacterium]